MHMAARHGHVAVVQQLLSAHAAVGATRGDLFSRTPLDAAATSGRAAVVQRLLAAGAAAGAADSSGSTPLHEAAQKGHAAAML